MVKMVSIKPISDAATRMSTGQITRTFVINMLKDYLRANYAEYESATDKGVYCLNMLEFAFTQTFAAGANDHRIWETLQTPFGEQRKLSKLGTYIFNVHRLYQELNAEEIEDIINHARAKVG